VACLGGAWSHAAHASRNHAATFSCSPSTRYTLALPNPQPDGDFRGPDAVLTKPDESRAVGTRHCSGAHAWPWRSLHNISSPSPRRRGHRQCAQASASRSALFGPVSNRKAESPLTVRKADAFNRLPDERNKPPQGGPQSAPQEPVSASLLMPSPSPAQHSIHARPTDPQFAGDFSGPDALGLRSGHFSQQPVVAVGTRPLYWPWALWLRPRRRFEIKRDAAFPLLSQVFTEVVILFGQICDVVHRRRQR
jgi:hypothetical protein